MDKVQKLSNPEWIFFCFHVKGWEGTYTAGVIEGTNPNPWTRDYLFPRDPTEEVYPHSFT
jgi:hypothetical protein